MKNFFLQYSNTIREEAYTNKMKRQAAIFHIETATVTFVLKRPKRIRTLIRMAKLPW